MTERDRLILLLQNFSDGTYFNNGYIVDNTKVVAIADHLISNGVIVPPCKVGDKIYRIASSEYKERIWEWKIYSVTMYEEYILYQDDSDNVFCDDDIGKTVFLTKEEAEKALKEREQG